VLNTQLSAVSNDLNRLQQVAKQAATSSPQAPASTHTPQNIGGVGAPVVKQQHQGKKLDFQA
jgi:hypothetical protein